jgi:hypothetical protein
MFVAFAAPASAQVHVDVGVMSRNVGARVVVGGPRVVYVPVDRYREPVYSRRVIYPRRDDRYYRGRNWDRRDREYYRDVREARREYERDLRDARRDYERDLREAERDRRR